MQKGVIKYRYYNGWPWGLALNRIDLEGAALRQEYPNDHSS